MIEVNAPGAASDQMSDGTAKVAGKAEGAAVSPERRILIVEDDALLALAAQHYLEGLGWRSAATAHSLAEAQKLAAALDFDVALVDVNLQGNRAWSIADILRGRGIPFVLATGYTADDLPAGLRGAPLLVKPYRLEELARELCRALGVAATDGVSGRG